MAMPLKYCLTTRAPGTQKHTTTRFRLVLRPDKHQSSPSSGAKGKLNALTERVLTQDA